MADCEGPEIESFPPILHGVFGVARIKVHMLNRFDLQEVAFLGEGRWSVFAGAVISKASLAGMDGFYDKGCPIATWNA
ncbi:MAG TPA: hypothetical protein VLM78_08235 [Anaerolineales bacterium]|nr:hypothetical protein [Anaerolineales bacterium]